MMEACCTSSADVGTLLTQTEGFQGFQACLFRLVWPREQFSKLGL